MPEQRRERNRSRHGRGITAGSLCGLLLLFGCASSATLLTESDHGGTVVYSYFDDQDVLSSASRRDALRLLDAKCPGGYRVSREGQIPQISRAVDQTWKGQVSGNGQVSREKQWAIQFICKSSDDN